MGVLACSDRCVGLAWGNRREVCGRRWQFRARTLLDLCKRSGPSRPAFGMWGAEESLALLLRSLRPFPELDFAPCPTCRDICYHTTTEYPETENMAADPLDEIQWRKPPNFEQGIHSNSVLYYFAESPFFDKTSNNAIVFQQGLTNANMTPFLGTRERFEGRLQSMSGLEFIVAQEPAETGPGAGTGVWIINKQTRRKRQGEEDEIVVHATYFIVGENIYMAPTLADVISSRMVHLVYITSDRRAANYLTRQASRILLRRYCPLQMPCRVGHLRRVAYTRLQYNRPA